MLLPNKTLLTRLLPDREFVMPDEQTETHVPDEGVVDDRNTMEGQMVGAGQIPHLSDHLLVQIKKYLDGLEYPAAQAEIKDYAASQGAGADVLATLDTLQGPSYKNYTSVRDELIR